MFHRIPPFLKNRYAIVLIGFVIYISFFDSHDLISQIKIKQKLAEIQGEIDYLNEDSEKAERQIIELTTNDAALEKFAREEYLMKRENEEIFVLVEKE